MAVTELTQELVMRHGLEEHPHVAIETVRFSIEPEESFELLNIEEIRLNPQDKPNRRTAPFERHVTSAIPHPRDDERESDETTSEKRFRQSRQGLLVRNWTLQTKLNRFNHLLRRMDERLLQNPVAFHYASYGKVR